jgi:hypothetical protein
MPQTLADTELRMAVKTVNIRRNADNTLTVRTNNYTESIGIENKTEKQIFDAVKYALICANFEWTNEVADLVRQELGENP